MSMAAWTAAVGGVIGAVVGVVLPRIGLVVAARGACPAPGRSVAARCRHRMHVPLSVAATSLTMAWFGWRYSGSTLPAWCWLAITGVCLAHVDVECQRLPRMLVAAMGLGGFLVLLANAVMESKFDSLATALAAMGVTTLIVTGMALAAPSHVGGGDVTLYPVLALYLGWWGWTTLLLGMLAGALLNAGWAMVLLLRGRARWRRRFAAGPALILGALVVIAFGVETGAA